MLPPRKQHLFRLWKEALSVETLPQFDRWLSDTFRRNSKFGSRDRKWYSEMLFAGVRFGYLALFCEGFAARQAAPTPEALRSFLAEFEKTSGVPEAVVARWRDVAPERFFAFVGERYRLGQGAEDASQLLGGPAVREILEAVRDLGARELDFSLLFASVPLWYRSAFLERVERSSWSESEAALFLENQNVRPPLWLRVNHPAKTEEVIERLRAQNFVTEREGLALRVTGTTGIAVTDVYKNGLIEVQDLASQMAGAVVAARPGDVVWDACAGGGGKTLQLAARLENRGAVYASDVREYKLDEVRLRARRAGFFNVRCLPWDGIELPEFQREVQKRRGFDWVLVDAPCSATGTWRRNPDAKYRLGESSVRNLSELQLGILKKASQAVAPGGSLVYATCSWLVAENEAIAEAFLQSSSDFFLRSSELFGNPRADADTLYAACFQRKE